MIDSIKKRSYNLEGDSAKEAAAKGLISAEWFACNVDRKVMKQLMQRDDKQALAYLGSWFLLLIASGVLAYFSWSTLWAIPAFFAYGLLYSAGEHGSHELSHGTPFKTQWLNMLFFQLTSFMALHEPVYWRWSHARHHTDTLIVGNDREIAFPRPFGVIGWLLDFFFLKSGSIEFFRTIKHAFGVVSPATRSFVPASEIPKMIISSRIHTLIYAVTLTTCAYSHSILPAMFVVLPRFYGSPLTQVFNITQHAGLAEDVLDHRLNTRTVIFNPVSAFMYMNMNYHIEHHMFPMVPFYNLPKLHGLIKDQCAPASQSLWEAYKEIFPAIMRQRRDPEYFIRRVLPQV
ncbi:fatty acid desaturase [Leeia oryzae]|uniref:fatty acid desaturase n=1 Tax=Leeia oryzae TaxID=356662 RepID=UPI00036A9B10|nr:fatty acid desaturase [Leeia oryzae]